MESELPNRKRSKPAFGTEDPCPLKKRLLEKDAEDLLGKFFPAAEVAKHNTINDLWVVVDGKVYNITDWIPKHPGGTAPLTYGGKDVTRIFHKVHNKGVLDRHREYLIGTTDVAEASDDLGDAVQESKYDPKADPDQYDLRKPGAITGKWGVGREFGDHMAEEGETSHIPTVIIIMYAAIFGWSMLSHWITGCNWWTMCAFYIAGMVAFYIWHRMAHSDWTGEMHECHMEHHIIRFPPSDFYGSAENFARMYPDGKPTLLTLMNLAKTTNVANTNHTPMIHEGPLFVFMFLILIAAYFVCKCTVGTLFMAFVLYAVMGTVGNAVHMSFHVREFHLEKYAWYRELRTLHYIHHLGDMKTNFAMVNLGLETVLGSLAIEDPACKSKAQSVAEILTTSPVGGLPNGITKEGLASTTQHFGFSSAVLGMNTPEAPRKTSLAVKRGFPTVLLRILLMYVSLCLWFWTEKSLSINMATALNVNPSWTDPGQDLVSAGYRTAFLTPLCVTSCWASEVTVLICILTALFGKTVRPFLSLVIVFLLRLLMRASGALQLVPQTDSVSTWIEPQGMPRLFVSPPPESNIFFSGRVAVATIACCELIHLACKCHCASHCRTRVVRGFLVLLGLTYLLGTVWLSIFTRSSWTFDCVVAFATARYSSFAAKRYSRVIDNILP